MTDKKNQESELAGLAQTIRDMAAAKEAAEPVRKPEMSLEQRGFEEPGYGLPPIYANRFNLWANDQICRFIIGDSISGNDLHYKMSFVMTREDAREFIKVTKDLLDNTEPVLK